MAYSELISPISSQASSVFISHIHTFVVSDIFYVLLAIRLIKSRRKIWAGHVARMGEGRSVYRVVVREPEGKRPLGRPRHRWEDNIKMDSQEVECEGMDWIDLAEDRDRWRTLLNAVMNRRVP